MSERGKKIAFGAFVVAFGAVLLWAYLRFVWYAGPTLAWTHNGEPYELLAPRMLGLALLAPYFVWMIGRSLADLPLAQRVLSAVLRTAFVALLALGLARVARTATTQKVCTVYLVDVSDSVPDASLDDAESTIAPVKELVVDGKTASQVHGFHVGVRREMWIYLLLLVVLISAIEWATYHRRVTV